MNDESYSREGRIGVRGEHDSPYDPHTNSVFSFRATVTQRRSLRHTVSRNMSGSPLGDAAASGGVGQAILPHRTEMEKECPLLREIVKTAAESAATMLRGCRRIVRAISRTRGYRFSLSSHFRASTSNWISKPTFFFGRGFFCFLLFFPFYCSLGISTGTEIRI